MASASPEIGSASEQPGCCRSDPIGLERAFLAVQRERMGDVALLNGALTTEAIGFRDWRGGSLGVLLTPWFMSLMLLPGTGEQWTHGTVGDRRQWCFPSGRYEFICSWHAAVGWYHSCSLFSPVFEFDSQDQARAVALAALEALLEPQGVEQAGDLADQAGEAPARCLPLQQRMERPLSRRRLLSRVLLRDLAEPGQD